VVALASRFPSAEPLIKLSEPYDALSSWWVIGLLTVLLLIEVTVDKIPAVDTLNDLIQTLVRPVAGAILFAGSANVITDISPVIALAAGLLLAGSVHATKGVVRPAITATTAGTGNWLVSIVEDIMAFTMSLLAILLPILALLLFIFLVIVVFMIVRRIRRRRQLMVR
jgi:hypothetical protein